MGGLGGDGLPPTRPRLMRGLHAPISEAKPWSVEQRERTFMIRRALAGMPAGVHPKSVTRIFALGDSDGFQTDWFGSVLPSSSPHKPIHRPKRCPVAETCETCGVGGVGDRGDDDAPRDQNVRKYRNLHDGRVHCDPETPERYR